MIDPNDTSDVSLDTAKHIDINLDVTDTLQKYSIQFIKTDEAGNMLPNAKFALKAACEIVDRNGKTIFKKVIRSQRHFLEMISLVIWNFSDCQLVFMQKMVLEKEMYTVEEVEAPLDMSNQISH